MHKLAATSLVPAQQCWTACWKQPSQCGSAGPAIGAVQQLSRRGDHHQCHALHCDGMALLSRRSALAVATLVSAPMLPQQEWSANAAADATAEAKKTCAQQLNPQTATAFFYALAEAVETQAGMPQQEFQQQAAALALRELRREAGAGLRAPVAGEPLTALPDAILTSCSLCLTSVMSHMQTYHSRAAGQTQAHSTE
jgi:hypothetical protein